MGEDAEKEEEEGKPYRSSAIPYTIDMIIVEEMPKLWLIKWYYQKIQALTDDKFSLFQDNDLVQEGGRCSNYIFNSRTTNVYRLNFNSE